jgi:hypothetical protein
VGWSLLSNDDKGLHAGITNAQAAAAASPYGSIRDLAGGDMSAPENPLNARRDRPAHDCHHGDSRGSFQDFDALFEQLEKAPAFELAKPPPADRYLPHRRVGSNAAEHNRALLGEQLG